MPVVNSECAFSLRANIKLGTTAGEVLPPAQYPCIHIIYFPGVWRVFLEYTIFCLGETGKNVMDMRNSLHEEIKNVFDETGIEIPFPHRTLYTGSNNEPFPVRVVDKPKD